MAPFVFQDLVSPELLSSLGIYLGIALIARIVYRISVDRVHVDSWVFSSIRGGGTLRILLSVKPPRETSMI